MSPRFPVKLGTLLYRIAGVPSLTKPRSLSIFQGIFAALCLFGHASLLPINVYIFFRGEKLVDDGIKLYSRLFWIAYPLGSLMVAADIIFKSRDITALLYGMYNIHELMRTNRLKTGSKRAFLVFTRCLMAVTVISIVLDAINVIFQFFNLNEKESLDNFIKTSTFVVSIPPSVLFWVICYNVTLGYLMELEFMDCICHELRDRSPHRGIAAVLPAVEVDSARIPDESLHRCTLWNLTLIRYQKLLKIHRQIKSLKLLMNRCCHFSALYMMFSCTCYYPLSILAPRQTQHAALYRVADVVRVAYALVGSVGKAGPIVCSQLVKYKGEQLVRKISREIATTKEPALREALLNLVNSAKDSYPNSPCVLTDFDASLLPTLLDTVVLIVATMFHS